MFQFAQSHSPLIITVLVWLVFPFTLEGCSSLVSITVTKLCHIIQSWWPEAWLIWELAIPSELLTLYQIFNSCVSLSSPKLEIIYRPFLEVSNLFLSFVSLVLIPDLVVGTHPSYHMFFPSALLTIIYHDRVETWFLMPSKIY